MLVGALWFSVASTAQSAVAFTSETEFKMADGGYSIRFAQNGTYAAAAYENDSWVFSDLQLNGSPTVEYFRVSTRGGNMTVKSFLGIVTDEHSGALNYDVSGRGVQAVNFGLSEAFAKNPNSHYVVVRLDPNQYPDFHPEGDGWYFSEDGTITVTNATTDTYIFYRDYSDALIDQSLPFYQTHTVTITALSLAAAVAVICVALRLRVARGEKKP